MKAGDRPTRSRSHATTTAKRRQAPKAARVSSPAKTGRRNSRPNGSRTACPRTSGSQGAASSDSRGVGCSVSNSPTGIQPVFDRIVKNAARLCQSVLSAVYLLDGHHVHLVAYDQFSPESVAAVRKAYPAPLTSGNLISVAIRERRVIFKRMCSSPVDTASCSEHRAIAVFSSCRCCATRSRSVPSPSCGLSRNYFPRRRSSS